MWPATNFEFKYRFWIFGVIFWASFASYSLDRKNIVQWLLEWNPARHGGAPPDWQFHLTFAFAALLCLANAALRTWGTAYLNAAVMVDGQVHTSRLLADGPYRYVRNPLYLGNVLLALGVGLMTSRLGFAILVCGMIIYVYRLIAREEAGILASQGESFRAYCAAVPRLLPALRPRVPPAGAKPNWKDGFLGEAFMWVMVVAIAGFAVSLNLTIFWIALVSAFVVYGICYVVIRKSGGKPAADRQPSSAEHSRKQTGAGDLHR